MFNAFRKMFLPGIADAQTHSVDLSQAKPLPPPPKNSAVPKVYDSVSAENVSLAEFKTCTIAAQSLMSVWTRFEDTQQKKFTLVFNPLLRSSAFVVMGSPSGKVVLEEAASKVARMLGGKISGLTRERSDGHYLVIDLKHGLGASEIVSHIERLIARKEGLFCALGPLTLHFRSLNDADCQGLGLSQEKLIKRS